MPIFKFGHVTTFFGHATLTIWPKAAEVIGSCSEGKSQNLLSAYPQNKKS